MGLLEILLLVFLVMLLMGALPVFPHSRSWGYAPSTAHHNLIAYNQAGGRFARPSAEDLAVFRARLEKGGVKCTVRRSPGDDIEAACGQLALRRTGGARGQGPSSPGPGVPQ